jgi:hypothetical protein
LPNNVARLKAGTPLAVMPERPDHRQPFTRLLLEMLWSDCSLFKDKNRYETHAHKIVRRLIAAAELGSMDAIKEIITRVDGKPIQPIAIPGFEEGDGDVEFSVSIGRRGADGSEETATLHARKTVGLPEAE